MRARASLLLTTACALSSLSASPATAAPGALDRTFGDGGTVTTNFSRGSDGASDVAIQANGKILAVGRASTRNYYGKFAVARYRTNGHLDPAFGGDGLVTTNFAKRQDAASAVAIQDDGGIVVAGSGSLTTRDGYVALARYHPDGTLDGSFGDAGLVRANPTTGDDYAGDVAIQADGRIVVGGTVGAGKFAVLRFNADGTPDDTFSGDGVVKTDVATGYDSASSVAVDAGGNIVVAGTSGEGSFAAVRFTSAGTPDATFDGDGIVTTDLTEGYDAANSVAIDAAGNVLLAGEAGFCCEYTGSFGLVRYDAGGTLDLSFGGGDGIAITNFTRTDDAARDVAIQANGKIVAVGTEGFNGAHSRFALARYTSDGILDPTFGDGGRVVTAFSKGFDSASSVAIQTDGKIVAAGVTYPDPDGLDALFALARYGGAG
jgi:uncharacterized delta-60 repeat protein